MRFRIRFLVPIVLLPGTTLLASVPCTLPSGIERLSNGNTLITDAGLVGQPTARVIEVDSLGKLVWAYVRSDIPWAHTARRIPTGNTLISATNDNRVIEVDPQGNVVWQMTAGLNYPNEAYRLTDSNTLITDRDNDRVIEVDSGCNLVWSYTNLQGPHNGNRLANGNTLICDSDGNKVVEVTPAGGVKWQYSTGLSWPRSAQRLGNGNTLIADSYHNRVIEVDSAGTILWSLTSGLSTPYQAIRLDGGNTLVSTGARVIEVDSARTIVWQYPPAASAVAVETLWVTNPTSGCSLYVHIHRPAGAGQEHKVPAVILIPRESYPGTAMDQNGLANQIASDGFAALHFDAEGRGRSGGPEDYNGYVHQDGLQACALALASKPYVDTENFGIYTRGYGIVMASGMLARHDSPYVKFLMDFEGPSDRYQVSTDSGGHVPVPVDSDAFWVEREAGRFMKNVHGAYLRIQTAIDMSNRIPDNHHAIDLIDSATSTAHGGSGVAEWTRVNDSVMNEENRTYTVSDPPLWIPEAEERHIICRELLYLHMLADPDFQVAVSTPPILPNPSSFSVFPNPCRSSALLHLNTGQLDHPTTLRVFNVSGRLILSPQVRTSSFTLPVSSLSAGVYVLRFGSGGSVATARLVVQD